MVPIRGSAGSRSLYFHRVSGASESHSLPSAVTTRGSKAILERDTTLDCEPMLARKSFEPASLEDL